MKRKFNEDVDQSTNKMRQIAPQLRKNEDLIEHVLRYFKNKQLYSPIGEWDVSNITSTAYLFNIHLIKKYHKNVFDKVFEYSNDLTIMENSMKTFNEDISKWNVSKVTNMTYMFSTCVEYNSHLNDWDVSNVRYFKGMFSGCTRFNQPLDKWNVSNAEIFDSMFFKCTSFNQPIGNWNVSNAISMMKMFANCYKFNQPLNEWNVSNVINTKMMFFNAKSFNQPLNDWTIDKLEYLEDMFDGADNFKLSNIEKWNLSTSDLEMAGIPFSVNNKKTYKYIQPQDRTALKINELHQQFSSNNTTINNIHEYIDDRMIEKETRPYLIHYESDEFEPDLKYPVITLLKGTLLFTARSKSGANELESFEHLYKIATNDTLSSYMEDDFKNVLTYFFPVPYMSSIVSTEFKRLDMVVLTEDVKLLCLISPSTVNRGHKSIMERERLLDNDGEYYYDYNKDKTEYPSMFPCKDRNYDFCMSTDLIETLQLNGYIALTYCDTPSDIDKMKIVEKIIDDVFMNMKNSLLYMSSCFNNEIYEPRNKSLGNSFIDKMIDCRTFGIPEIVLIPYNYHENQRSINYNVMKNEFNINYLKNPRHFVFKGIKAVSGNNSFELASKMTSALIHLFPLNSVTANSAQAPNLFKLLISELENGENNEYIVNDITLDALNFFESYKPNSTSKCAFEMVGFYELLDDDLKNRQLTGGRTMLNKMLNDNSTVEKSDSMKLQQKQVTNNILSTKDIVIKPLIKTENIYYNEASGFPIFVYVEKPSNVGGRKSKKRKHHRNKRKTLKRK